MNRRSLVTLCELLDQELARREAARDVSELAAGAAFEQWLSFETRLLLERSRANLGMPEQWWTANELRKVDLGVWSDEQTLHVSVEFKLFHNNKNWKAKVDGTWEDLFPAPDSLKASLRAGRHVAIVGVIGKVYTDSSNYPGQCTDLQRWEADLWSYALPSSGEYAGRVEQAWSGTRFRICNRYLDPSRNDHFFQLHLLVRADEA